MKNTLHEIKSDYLVLMNDLELADGEITDELNEALKINESQLQVKSIAYLSVIQQKEEFINTIDNEIKRLQQLKKINGNLVDRLKNSLLDAVKLFGDFTIGLNKFGTRKSTSVEVIAEANDLPLEFKTTKLTVVADKAAIKKALQSGRDIVGCTLKENLNLKIN